MIPESVGEIIPEWVGDMDRNQHRLGVRNQIVDQSQLSNKLLDNCQACDKVTGVSGFFVTATLLGLAFLVSRLGTGERFPANFGQARYKT